MKTGSYTFELPLQLGAVLAGGSHASLQALSSFALPLGQAFQIVDDLLGSLGSPEVTGKPNASDLREGKRTLLIARALEMAGKKDVARLRAGVGRADLPDAEAAELREILLRSGAAQACRDEAERLCEEAIAALDRSPIPPRSAEALRQIATYVVRRAS
jgi:geranylgeranyl diphosphate synthase type I